ncbi:MAG: tetratricopeptide repeat protein [Saprospiraceae bacterium]|nr:tetratricopeptide repeat protein [Saprospiraceae bacterium]
MDRLSRLQQLLEESPGDLFLLFAIAKELEGRGDNDQSLAYYQQLLSLDSDYVGAYYHLGKLYERMGDPRQSWDTYTKGMEVALRLGDTHANSELVGARMQLGDEEDFA